MLQDATNYVVGAEAARRKPSYSPSNDEVLALEKTTRGIP
jgi:hypothetical protein